MRNKLIELIDSSDSERPIHRFLEDNPHVLAGSLYVLSSAVISEFRLGTDFRADFALVNPTSGFTYLHLIEIERPAMRLFNADSYVSADFAKAMQQTSDWVHWCSKNQGQLRDTLGLLYEGCSESVPSGFLVKTLLIAGRRESLKSARAKERFAQLSINSGGLSVVRTYDGFLEDVELVLRFNPVNRQGIRCVTYADRSFRAKVEGSTS